MMHARRTEEAAMTQPSLLCCSTMQIMQIIQEYLAIALPHGPSRLNNVGDTLVASLLTAEFPQQPIIQFLGMLSCCDVS